MEGLKTPEQYSRGDSDSPKDAILKTSFIELMGNQPIVPKIALTLPVEEVASVQDFHQMTADLSPAMAGLPNASVLAQIRSVFQKFSSTDILDGGHEVDLDSSPPDFGLAELHRKSFSVAKQPLSDEINTAERKSALKRACPCCLHDPEAQPFSICCHPKELVKCGLGYVLYFQLIKFAIFLCFIMSLFQIPKVIRNMSSDLCVSTLVSDVCQRNWITVHSVANFGAQSVDLQDKFVTLGSLILFGLLIGCYKRIAETQIQQVQPKTSSASDWTVKIKFDKQRPSEDKIRELIYRIAPNVKIQKINSCYKLDEFTEQFNKVSLLKKELRRLKVQEFSRLREEKNKLIAQERENRGTTNILGAEDNLEFSKMATEKILMETQLQETQYFKVLQQYQQEANNLEELRKRIPEETEKYYTGISFITFETRAMAEEVLQTTFKVNTALIKLLKSRVHRNNSNSILQDFKLSRPDQPSAIFWQNIGVPTSKVRRARLISFTATILLIAASLLILIFLKRIQITVIPPVENDMFTLANLKPWTISVIMMFVVVIINSSLAYTLRILNGKEHYETTNAYMPALTIKIAMAQFINSNLLIVLTHVLVQVPNGIKIYARNGLLFDAWTLLLGEALVPPLLLCCNPLRIYSWLCRICIRLKARTCFGKLMTQREVNSVYEKSIFDPAMAYSNLIRIILMSFFLQPMFPSSIFIATVSFAVIYWVEKYSLLRHSAKTVTIDAGLCHQTLYLLNHAGLVYGLSQIIFDFSFYGRILPASMLILVIGSVLCVVPAQKLLELLGACCLKLTDRGNRTRVSQNRSKPRQDKYSEQYELARETFNSEYDRSNPITSPESNREYFKYMVQRMDSSKIIKLADSLLLQNIQRNLDQNQYFGNPERHQFTRPQPMYDFKNHLDKDPHFFEIIANISGAVDDIFSNSNRPQTKELPGYIVNYFCQNQMLSVDSLTNNLLAVLSRKHRNKNSAQQAGNDLQQTQGNPLGQGRTNQPSHTVRLPVDHLDQDGEGDLGSTNRDLQGKSKQITPRVLVPTPSRRLPGLFDRNQNSKRSLLSAGPELGLLSSRALPSPTSANFTTNQGRNLASEAGTPNASVSTSKNQAPVILKARSPSRVSVQIKKVSQPKSGQGFRDLAEGDPAHPKEMTPKAKLVPPKIIGSQR